MSKRGDKMKKEKLTCTKCGKAEGFKTKNKRERIYVCRNCGAEQSIVFVNGVEQVQDVGK